ncbi:high nitrogen upregulated cytochrome P450 monooxygenase 2 [Earliella scabrosa]|nr:high nitrogen upregulated cytochrome P450 monooxygenase 2 [Earliella scabrosa]
MVATSLFQYYQPPTLLVCLALVAHWVFRTYETFSVTAHTALLLATPPLVIYWFVEQGYTSSSVLQDLFFGYGIYFASIATSVVAYRLSPLHPLARYPGPTKYKLSKLVWAYETTLGDSHYRLKALHERYGDVVRTGPNELSVRHVDAVSAVLGVQGAPKSPFYIGASLGRGAQDGDGLIVGIRNIDLHMRRRRAWSRAFSTAALRDMQEHVAPRVRLLVDTLEARVSEAVLLDVWINYFAYDTMCDIVFGGGSELLREGDRSGIWAIIHTGVVVATFLSHVPWLGVYVGHIPGAGGALDTLTAFAHKLTADRVRQGTTRRDLFHYLNNDDLEDVPPPPMKQLLDDGMLALVAGTDTTAGTLTSVFFCLATHPGAYAALRNEVDCFFPAGEDPLMYADYREMRYLNAVINEAMRLFPVLPGGGPRWVPPRGAAMVVCSYVIPPDTSVWVPTYSLHRDGRNFSFPDVFWPERWLVASGHLTLDEALRTLPRDGYDVTSSPPAALYASHANSKPDPSAKIHVHYPLRGVEFVHNEVAFTPFSHGPMYCAGKNLALLEMRMVVCALVQRFEVRLEEGWDVRRFGREYRDHYIAAMAELPVRLEVRK